MTLMERLRWAAKTTGAVVGAVATFIPVVISVTDDGAVDAGEWGILATAVVTLVGTVIAVFKLENKDPE